jgi:hypothetical protein
MKHLIVVAGVIMISGPAFAGSSCFLDVNSWGQAADIATGLEKIVGMSATRAKKVAACFKRHGSNGKSITERQWLFADPREEHLPKMVGV